MIVSGPSIRSFQRRLSQLKHARQQYYGGINMSFSDMIKKSILEGFSASDLGTASILIYLAVSAALGLYIYFIYRISSKSGFYNKFFNKTLACLPVITTGIILAMQSNLVISLGMVGALSIVRFRNAIKDPIDLTFLFWSISAGIIVGAKLFELAILVSLCITVLIFGLDFLPSFRAPFILAISTDSNLEETALLGCVKSFCSKSKIRSRSCSPSSVEWILEIQTKQHDELVKKLLSLPGVRSLNLLSHDGDVRF